MKRKATTEENMLALSHGISSGFVLGSGVAAGIVGVWPVVIIATLLTFINVYSFIDWVKDFE